MAFDVLRVGSHIFWKCLCRSELACNVTGTQRSKYLSGRGRAFAFIIQLIPVSHRPIDSAPRLLCIISERSITRYSVQSHRVTGNHGRLIVYFRIIRLSQSCFLSPTVIHSQPECWIVRERSRGYRVHYLNENDSQLPFDWLRVLDIKMNTQLSSARYTLLSYRISRNVKSEQNRTGLLASQL